MSFQEWVLILEMRYVQMLMLEVLQNLHSVTLGYPEDLKSTFEMFQKILLEVDPTKLSPKVHWKSRCSTEGPDAQMENV